jgi:hypothetical protein
LAKYDRLDALAMAVARWVEVMDKDQMMLEEQHKDAARDAEVQRFLERAGVLGKHTGVLGEYFGQGETVGFEMGV